MTELASVFATRLPGQQNLVGFYQFLVRIKVECDSLVGLKLADMNKKQEQAMTEISRYFGSVDFKDTFAADTHARILGVQAATQFEFVEVSPEITIIKNKSIAVIEQSY